MSSRFRSPARSQGARTPRRLSTRSTKSAGSPARSTGRLSTLVDQFKDQNVDSFVLSPVARHSVLSDTTQIAEPRRKSWWKKLDDNSREVLIEAMSDNRPGDMMDVVEQLDVEILSQEKRNITLDMPESSSSESIASIVIPQRKLFTQKDTVPTKKKFGKIIGPRESMVKANKTNIDIQDVGPKKLFGQTTTQKTYFPNVLNTSSNKTKAEETKVSKKLFGQSSSTKLMFPTEVVNVSPRSSAENIVSKKKLFQHDVRAKTVFPAALLAMSPNKTTNKTLGGEVKGQVRSLFGNKGGTKRKNVFADFIVSESEDELPEIQPKVFGFQKRAEMRRRGSSTSIILADDEDDWKMLPSSTMMELDGTPVKKPKLSRITQSDNHKSRPVNKSINNKTKDKTTEVTNASEASSNVTKKNTTKDMQKEEITKELDQNEQADDENNALGLQALDEDNESSAEEDNQEVEEENQENGDEQEEEETEHVDKNEQEVDEVMHKVDDLHREDDPFKQDVATKLHQNKTLPANLNRSDSKNNKINKTVGDNKKETSVLKQNLAESVLKDHDESRERNNYLDDQEENIEKYKVVDTIKESEQIIEGIFNESLREMEVESILQDAEDEAMELTYEEENQDQNENDVEQKENLEGNDQDAEMSEKEEEQEVEVSQHEQEESENEEESQQEEDENEENVEVSQQEEDEEEEASQLEEDENEEVSQQEESVEISQQEEDEEEEASQQGEDENEDESQQEEEQEVEVSQQEGNEEEMSQQEEVQETEVSQQEEDENEEEAEASLDQDENEDNVDSQQEVENDEAEISKEEEDQEVEVSQQEEEENEEAEVEESQENIEENEEEVEEDAEDEEIEQDVEESEQKPDQSLEQDEEMEESQENDVEDVENEEPNEQSENEIQESPNVTHDTTGRNRKIKSPEAILQNNANRNDSFEARRLRNTSIRKTKSMIQPNLEPSLRISVGTNSSAEGSGWDSHRVTKKTIRQTFGKGYTPRKSLRALVMEKSAQRQTLGNEVTMAESMKIPQANSTEIDQVSMHFDDNDPVSEESDLEVTRKTRQTTLEMYLQKVKKDNMERKKKMESAVRTNIQARTRDLLDVYNINPKFGIRKPKPQIQTKPKKVKPSAVPLGEIPEELVADLKSKPPKRFIGSNASWITKRLYRFLEAKLEPRYDYKARVKAEQLVEKIFTFTKLVRRFDVAPPDAAKDLAKEMAKLRVVTTHADFYEFFHEFMPREIRLKVIPDVNNRLRLPSGGPYAPILRDVADRR